MSLLVAEAPVSAIAGQLGVHRNRVYRLAARLGLWEPDSNRYRVERRVCGTPWICTAPVGDAEFRELASNLRVVDMAELLGIEDSRVSKRAAALGVRCGTSGNSDTLTREGR